MSVYLGLNGTLTLPSVIKSILTLRYYHRLKLISVTKGLLVYTSSRLKPTPTLIWSCASCQTVNVSLIFTILLTVFISLPSVEGSIRLFGC